MSEEDKKVKPTNIWEAILGEVLSFNQLQSSYLLVLGIDIK